MRGMVGECTTGVWVSSPPMGIEQSVAVALAVFVCGWVVFRRRRIDMFAIAVSSMVLYHLPLLTGWVLYPTEDRAGLFVQVSPGAFIAVSVYGAGLLSAMVVQDRNPNRPMWPCSPTLGIWVLLGITAAVAAWTLFKAAPVAIAGGEKAEVMAQAPYMSTVWNYLGRFAAVAAWLSKRRAAIVLAAAMLLARLFLGFRSDLVIVVLAICVLEGMARPADRLLLTRHGLALLASAVAAVLVVVLVKPLVSVIRTLGDAEVMQTVVQNKFGLEGLVYRSEPNAISVLVNEAIVGGYSLAPWHHLHDLISFKALGMDGPLDAGRTIAQGSFPWADWGFGYSPIAEGWMVGGYLGVFVVSVVIGGLLIAMGALLRRSRQAPWRAALALCIVLTGFYWFRSDFSNLARGCAAFMLLGAVWSALPFKTVPRS